MHSTLWDLQKLNATKLLGYTTVAIAPLMLRALVKFLTFF